MNFNWNPKAPLKVILRGYEVNVMPEGTWEMSSLGIKYMPSTGRGRVMIMYPWSRISRVEQVKEES